MGLFIAERFNNVDYNKWLTIIGHFRTMLTRHVFASGINSATGTGGRQVVNKMFSWTALMSSYVAAKVPLAARNETKTPPRLTFFDLQRSFATSKLFVERANTFFFGGGGEEEQKLLENV